MNIYAIIIGCIIGVVIATIIKLVKFNRLNKSWEEYHERAKEARVLINKHLEYWSKLDYAISLRKVQLTALQKIKAICGHMGVEVKIDYLGYTNPDMTPSIDIIKSLGFMKEYLPEIEGLWQTYKENDADKYIEPLNIKRDWILMSIDQLPPYPWKYLTDEQKKKVIKEVSDQYDREIDLKNKSSTSSEENLIAQ